MIERRLLSGIQVRRWHRFTRNRRWREDRTKRLSVNLKNRFRLSVQVAVVNDALNTRAKLLDETSGDRRKSGE